MGQRIYRVAVVDDDSVWARYVTASLETVGVDVVATWSSAEEAVMGLAGCVGCPGGGCERLDCTGLDAILCDWRLGAPPTEAAAVEAVADVGVRVPIIVMTGSDITDDLLRQALEAGADALVPKDAGASSQASGLRRRIAESVARYAGIAASRERLESQLAAQKNATLEQLRRSRDQVRQATESLTRATAATRPAPEAAPARRWWQREIKLHG